MAACCLSRVFSWLGRRVGFCRSSCSHRSARCNSCYRRTAKIKDVECYCSHSKVTDVELGIVAHETACCIWYKERETGY
ncbi:hypothetical protein RSAG8_10943, partial [Rhizoctonia solani AG-8 WAC10335]